MVLGVPANHLHLETDGLVGNGLAIRCFLLMLDLQRKSVKDKGKRFQIHQIHYYH